MAGIAVIARRPTAERMVDAAIRPRPTAEGMVDAAIRPRHRIAPAPLAAITAAPDHMGVRVITAVRVDTQVPAETPVLTEAADAELHIISEDAASNPGGVSFCQSNVASRML